MASYIDTSGVPQVSPSGIPNDYLHVQTSPDMYGAEEARAKKAEANAIGDLGQAIAGVANKIGGDWKSEADKKKAIDNDLMVNDGKTSFSSDATKAWSEYATKYQGKEAQVKLADFNAGLEKRRQEIAETMPDDETRKRFLLTTSPTITHYGDAGQRFADQENKRWNQQSWTAGAAEAGTQAFIHREDPNLVDQNLNESDKQIRNMHEDAHEPQAAIGNAIRQNRGFNVSRIVQAYLQEGRLDKAQELYGKYKDQIDAGSAVAIEKVLKPAQIKADGADIKSRAMGTTGVGVGEGKINAVYNGSLTGDNAYGLSPSKTYSYLISKGATKNEALGLTGMAAAESSFNPYTTHDKGIGFGLWGHNGNRLDAMRAMSRSYTPNWQQQADFALKELRSRPESAAVNAAKTPEELTNAMMAFEAPRGYTPSTPQAGHNYTGRLNTIKRFAELTNGEMKGGDLVGESNIPPVDRQTALSRVAQLTSDPVVQREAISQINQAYQTYAGNTAVQNAHINEDLSAIVAQGQPVNNVTYDQVKAQQGPEAAEQFALHQAAAMNYYNETSKWKTLTAEGIDESLQKLAPQPGEKGWSYKQKLYEYGHKIAEARKTQMTTDPAGAVDDDPGVVKAKQGLNQNNPATYRALGQARMDAQKHLGLPDELQFPITVAQAKQYANYFRPLSKGQSTAEDQESIIKAVTNDVFSKYGIDMGRQAMRLISQQVTMKKEAGDVLADVIERFAAGQTKDLVTYDEANALRLSRDAEKAALLAGQGYDDMQRELSKQAASTENAKAAGAAIAEGAKNRPSVVGLEAMQDVYTGGAPANPLQKPFWQATDKLRQDPQKLMAPFIAKFGVQSVPRDLMQYVPQDMLQPNPPARPGPKPQGTASNG